MMTFVFSVDGAFAVDRVDEVVAFVAGPAIPHLGYCGSGDQIVR